MKKLIINPYLLSLLKFLKKVDAKMTTLFTIMCSILFCLNVYANTGFTGMRDITSMQIVANMGAGINITNALDAYPNETSWGNPPTTLAMITAFKQKGFKTLRLPVTWKDHLGSAPDYTIDPTWLARVEEVANYAFANDMYVVLNTHHEDWLQPTYANQATGTDKLVKVWIQIANRFKNYGDYLILETMNEPRAFGSPEEWTGGSAEHRDVVNAFNLAAVNAIRNTGGNNATRHLMIPTCGDNASSAAMNALVIPNNDSRIIVTVHIYSPYEFCLAVPGVSTWGTAAEKASLSAEFDVIYNKFITSGRAVVVGEWGAENKDNLSSLVTYADYFVKGCNAKQIGTIDWMYVFDRNALTWGQPTVIDAIVDPFKGIRVTGVTMNPTTTSIGVGATIQLASTVAPSDASNKTVSWNTSNSAVAAVSITGLVTGIIAGTTTITVTTQDGNKTATCIVTVTPPPGIISGDTYEIIARHSGKVIGINNASTSNGALAVQQTNTNGTSQKFVITLQGSGYYKISPASNSSKALEVNSTTNGATISQWTYGDANNQQWQIIADGSYYNIKSRLSGKCVNIDGASTSDGASVDQRTCDNGTNQQFSLLKSVIVGIEQELSGENGLTLYPNPAMDRLKVKLSDLSSQVRLYSIEGKQLIVENTRASLIEIDMTKFKSGIYLLKVISSGQELTQKIVKE